MNKEEERETKENKQQMNEGWHLKARKSCELAHLINFEELNFRDRRRGLAAMSTAHSYLSPCHQNNDRQTGFSFSIGENHFTSVESPNFIPLALDQYIRHSITYLYVT